MTHGSHQDQQGRRSGVAPSVVAWEMTRRCHLHCRHCRASALSDSGANELSFTEGQSLILGLRDLGTRLLILTGGEPMLREDSNRLARFAVDQGLRVVMAPCGPLLNDATVASLIEAGVSTISLSLDAADAERHDAFRGTPGAFDHVLRAMRCARRAGLPVQVNSTVTKLNVETLSDIVDLAEREGAVTVDFFFLVPVGRGTDMKELQLNASQTEQVLRWILKEDERRAIRIKSTCAPQMARIRQCYGCKPDAQGHEGGCMAGRGFLFVAHDGNVQPCGFLSMDCGNVREYDFSLKHLLRDAVALQALGERRDLGGACGQCAFLHTCGGCRARAYEMSGDVREEAPFCEWAESYGRSDLSREGGGA